jgi:hypothetical protein
MVSVDVKKQDFELILKDETKLKKIVKDPELVIGFLKDNGEQELKVTIDNKEIYIVQPSPDIEKLMNINGTGMG